MSGSEDVSAGPILYFQYAFILGIMTILVLVNRIRAAAHFSKDTQGGTRDKAANITMERAVDWALPNFLKRWMDMQ